MIRANMQVKGTNFEISGSQSNVNPTGIKAGRGRSAQILIS